MATVTYSNFARCSGGGHTSVDISINGGPTRHAVYDTDDLRDPLSNLTQEQQILLTQLILKVHFAGKTRQQILTETNAGPVVVTI